MGRGLFRAVWSWLKQAGVGKFSAAGAWIRERSKTIPQRLKPGQFAEFSGTTEVVPFQSSNIQGSSFSAACKVPTNFASFPARLKPSQFAEFSGTTEVVPFQGSIQGSGQCSSHGYSQDSGQGSIQCSSSQDSIQGSSQGSGFPATCTVPINFASFPPMPWPFKAVAWGLDLALAGGEQFGFASGMAGVALARRADDPKSRREKGHGPDGGTAAQKGGRAGDGGRSESEADTDRDPALNPENEGFAQHSEDDGVPDDMATLVLDNTRVGSGLGPGLNPARGQGTVLNPPDAPRVNYAEDESSDAAVMLRVAAGDEAGYNYLVGKYHRAMISFLFRMVHNQAVAEELAQEVFLRVYRSRESYRAEAKFTTWLYRIATNLAVNHARDTKHERSAQNVYLDAPDEESGTTPDVADATPTIEQTMLRDERMAAIRAHVMELPERQRMAVLMHKYQGMDYKQIGEVLKLSESATKSLLFRAYQTLREKLEDFV